MNTFTRFAIIKHGFVGENEVMIDNKFIKSFPTCAKAKNWVKERNNPSDYFIRHEEFDGRDWLGIEGTEILF